jgi:hypothetical protein
MLLAACGCDRAPSEKPRAPSLDAAAPSEPQPHAEEPPMEDSPVALSWSLSRVDSTLELQISVANHSDQPIYVADQLVVGKPGGNRFTRTDRITVMNDLDVPDLVLFGLASMSGDEPVTSLSTPTFRLVPVGETFARSISVPYPLQAWHPDTGVFPIAATARHAVVVVQYFVGEPPRWITLASDDPQPLKVPADHPRQALRSKPLPLP